MKQVLITLFALATISLSAQNITAERIADLRPDDYRVEGDAILRTYDDGTIDLSLSQDFDTPRGPDVQIFLSNGRTVENAVRIGSLSARNHFSGAATFPVPDSIDIREFNFVVMYCVAFTALWCHGELAALPPPAVCSPSVVTNVDRTDESNVCPGDGIPDVVRFDNLLAEADTLNYAYLITDENDVLQQVVMDTVFDFESSDSLVQRVYGIQFAGQLQPQIGADRQQTTASECYQHSSGSIFLTVNKTACVATSTVERALAAAINVYPNPTKGALQLAWPADFHPTRILVYDALGRVVLEQAATTRLDVQTLRAGSYSVRLETGVSGRFAVKRFVKR